MRFYGGKRQGLLFLLRLCLLHCRVMGGLGEQRLERKLGEVLLRGRLEGGRDRVLEVGVIFVIEGESDEMNRPYSFSTHVEQENISTSDRPFSFFKKKVLSRLTMHVERWEVEELDDGLGFGIKEVSCVACPSSVRSNLFIEGGDETNGETKYSYLPRNRLSPRFINKPTTNIQLLDTNTTPHAQRREKCLLRRID